MKILLLSLLVSMATPIMALAQAPPQEKSVCKIVDLVVKEAGEIDYVDGKRVPGNLVDIDYLREQEKSSPSPRSCLVLFATSSAKIRDIEGVRVIAGKMGYKDFHAYLYEPNRDSASEILYGPTINLNEVRSGPHGPVPWPGQEPERK